MARYEPQQTGKSLQDIAAMMTNRHLQEAGLDPDEQDELDSDDDLDTGDGDTDDDVPDDDEEQGGGDDDTDESDQDDTADNDDDVEDPDDDENEDADDETDDDLGEYEIDDDTLVEIDEDTQISLGELKSIYNADRSIADKVQQSTTALREATQRRSSAIDAAQKMHEAMRQMVQGIDEALNVPLVKQPDAALKQRDPNAYIRQLDAYQADQQRINETRQQVIQALEAHKNNFEENLKTRQQEEMAILASRVPAIKDPKTRETAAKDILQSAEHYGFSKEEVALGVDSRLYEMAYDAAQYRKLKGMSKNEKEKLVTKVKSAVSKQPKVLRSKGTNARQRAQTSDKRVKVLKSRAQKSGRPEDVAAFMSESRKRTR